MQHQRNADGGTVTLTRVQRDAFMETVDDVLYRVRNDDLRAFDRDPWGVIERLSMCADLRGQLDGEQETYTLMLCGGLDVVEIDREGLLIGLAAEVDERAREHLADHDVGRIEALRETLHVVRLIGEVVG